MKKMSFAMCIFMAVGCIIGAGIFAKTPLVIRLVGNGLVWGFLLAAVFVFLKTIPEVVLSSALPANGGAYMHLTRLVHPSLGVVHAFNYLVIGTMNVAIMSLVFATYFNMLFPSVPLRLVAVSVALVFTVMSTFGIRVSAWVQNVTVVILMLAIGVFIFGGLPSVKITVMDVIAPAVKVTTLWAAMGLLHGSLIGAQVLLYAADEIDRPHRTIPLVFIISTLICAAIFALMGFVALGNIPLESWLADWSLNLADVVEQYLPSGLVTFFIVGGPLLAVATSINAMILMFSRSHFAAARDGLFPVKISKLNKFQAPAYSIWLNTIIGILAIVSGLSLDDILLMVAVPGLVLSPVVYVAVFVIPKKFPNCYKNSFFNWPHWVNAIVVIVASFLCFALGGAIVSKLAPKNIITMIVFYLLAVVYTFIRWSYLKKKKGIDIFANMKTAYKPWVDRENELSSSAVIAD